MSYPQAPIPSTPDGDEFYYTTSEEGAATVTGSSYRTARFLYVWDQWSGDWSQQPLPPVDPDE